MLFVNIDGQDSWWECRYLTHIHNLALFGQLPALQLPAHHHPIISPRIDILLAIHKNSMHLTILLMRLNPRSGTASPHIEPTRCGPRNILPIDHSNGEHGIPLPRHLPHCGFGFIPELYVIEAGGGVFDVCQEASSSGFGL
jgi:hypothetical protein